MKKVIFALLAAALIMSGCAKQTQPGEIGIVQDDYILFPTAPELEDCMMPEESRTMFSKKVFRYPARQISWDATSAETGERGPYVVVSSAEAPAELHVPVVVTMDLTRDCETLKTFHRTQGTKYNAWLNDDGTVSEGWVKLLDYTVGQPTETTLTRLSQKYSWQEIWNDEAVRIEFEQALLKELPGRIEARAGGEYFTNIQVTVQKPDPINDELKSAIAQEQTAIAQANAKEEAAEAEERVAVADTRVAQERAKQQQAEIEGYPDIEAYLKAKLIDKGGNPYQPTIVPGIPLTQPKEG